MNGKNVKTDAEVRMLTPEGIYLVVEDKGYFASFKDFPFLADLPSTQVFDVGYCGHGHIRWELADIDLNTKILANPEKYPVSFQVGTSEAAARMGKIGGAVHSHRKAAASRLNGLKGGRPRKKKKELVSV